MKENLHNEQILTASKIIKNGGIVAFPTETVYGLGADAFNPIAVSKIFEVKKRPAFNPLIIHIASKETVTKITNCENEKVFGLINKFFPGPLTIILPKRNEVPDIVTAGKPSVGIRMPANEIAIEFISACETPIAAPSANLFGMLSPTTAEHVKKQIGEKIDFIIDGGKSSVGVESTIVEFADNKFYLLRYGGLPTEKIENVIGEKLIFKQNYKSPNSPGQLKSHYAPSIPIKFIDETDLDNINKEKTALLLFSKNSYGNDYGIIKILSPAGNLYEASANLFAFLHEIESTDVNLILAEKPPLKGLGLAIYDRLRKAVNRYK